MAGRRLSWEERQDEMLSRISDSSGSSVSSRVSTVSEDLYFGKSRCAVALGDSETCTKCSAQCAVFGGLGRLGEVGGGLGDAWGMLRGGLVRLWEVSECLGEALGG